MRWRVEGKRKAGKTRRKSQGEERWKEVERKGKRREQVGNVRWQKDIQERGSDEFLEMPRCLPRLESRLLQSSHHLGCGASKATFGPALAQLRTKTLYLFSFLYHRSPRTTRRGQEHRSKRHATVRTHILMLLART